MLELEEAVAQILAFTPQTQSELVAIEEAHGRYLVRSVLSPIDLPCFDNSAMDGYAVRACDVIGANLETPVKLRLAGRIAAGEGPSVGVTSGACVRVFTGSLLPHGADAVVMQEDTRSDADQADQIFITEPAKPWENVRFKGEDVKHGTLLVGKGERLGPGKLGLLAAAGIKLVETGRRPKVVVLATGTELREAGEELAPGQIYESNRISLAGLLNECGAMTKTFPLVPDSRQRVRSALESALEESDAVITSGGVSVGEMDLVKGVFEDVGGKMQFWRVAIKPGRPFVLGSYKNKLLFGLPGNPASAFVTFLLLVRPSLLRWQGAADVALPAFSGVLGEALANHGTRRHFMRVKMDAEGRIFSAGNQASHVLGSMAAANGLVDVPPETTLPVGRTIKVLRWE